MSATARAGPPEPPTLEFFLAFLAGVLVLVEGLVVLGGGVAPPGTVGVPVPAELPSLGALGVAVGIGVVGAGFALLENPDRRYTIGPLLVGLGAVSVIAGGGFVVGAALAISGGVLAVLRPPSVPHRRP